MARRPARANSSDHHAPATPERFHVQGDGTPSNALPTAAPTAPSTTAPAAPNAMTVPRPGMSCVAFNASSLTPEMEHVDPARLDPRLLERASGVFGVLTRRKDLDHRLHAIVSFCASLRRYV